MNADTPAPDAVKVVPDVDQDHPLCAPQIAMHTGILVYRAKDAAENLRRVKTVFATFRRFGVDLLSQGGRAWTEDDITPELIARHEGARSNWAMYTPASFDDHILDIIASHTGVPRVSYVHIRKRTPQLGFPCSIYQEVSDKTGEETRRVEVFPDGRHLWVENNLTGTGKTYSVDTEFRGLDELNSRPGVEGAFIDGKDFEELWERATGEDCRWIVRTDADKQLVHCGRHREEDDAWCAEHEELARLMFPRLHPSA